MSEVNQKSAQIIEYGQKLVLQDTPIKKPQPGELLVKVQASTINPSDRMILAGSPLNTPLPFTGGQEGTGKVIEANGEELQSWVGKRVTFTIPTGGAWTQYAITNPLFTFEIDEEVPLSTAASGTLNPLTVIGFVETFKALGKKGGIIHTAASSSVGRQLNRLVQKEGITLLNVVRRQEQADLLKSEGATHVIITEGNWVEELKNLIKEHDFNTFFDALGGGPVTDSIISSLPPKAHYFGYGLLEKKQFTISNPYTLFSGVNIAGYFFVNWWMSAGNEVHERVKKGYSELLKGPLKTKSYKEVAFADINKAIELSISTANEGKILLKIE